MLNINLFHSDNQDDVALLALRLDTNVTPSKSLWHVFWCAQGRQLHTLAGRC